MTGKEKLGYSIGSGVEIEKALDDTESVWEAAYARCLQWWVERE